MLLAELIALAVAQWIQCKLEIDSCITVFLEDSLRCCWKSKEKNYTFSCRFLQVGSVWRHQTDQWIKRCEIGSNFLTATHLYFQTLILDCNVDFLIYQCKIRNVCKSLISIGNPCHVQEMTKMLIFLSKLQIYQMMKMSFWKSFIWKQNKENVNNDIWLFLVQAKGFIYQSWYITEREHNISYLNEYLGE